MQMDEPNTFIRGGIHQLLARTREFDLSFSCAFFQPFYYYTPITLIFLPFF